MQASKREEAQQRAAAQLKRSRDPTPEDGMEDASKRAKGERRSCGSCGAALGSGCGLASKHNTPVLWHTTRALNTTWCHGQSALCCQEGVMAQV
jgi:hypothetical protein